MENKNCFIIMPISDNSIYPKGHFKRVYEHLIKPACKLAGFTPTRADDVINTNYIALDVVKRIIEADIAICDLSSQNPNVLYELGIRQAFNKPVVLIKDKQTKRIFDIQGFRDFEYDENLRIDNVQNEIQNLSEILTSTLDEKDDINSLVSLLGMKPAKVENETLISNDTKLILNSITGLEKRIRTIENNPRKAYYDNTGMLKVPKARSIPSYIGDPFTFEELMNLKEGDFVYHRKFGEGEIIKLIKIPENSMGQDSKAEINFNEFGRKTILLKYSPLNKIL